MLPKYPHAALICGQTGCGKTEFVLDLLSLPLEKGGYLKYFEYIVIMSYHRRKSSLREEKVDLGRRTSVHRRLAGLAVTRGD